MQTKKKKRLVLIDGNNLAYRAFYALPDTITTSSGVETNAVYGFTSMLLKLLEDMDPDDIICALDSKGPTFRHEIYDQYKANRKEMPDSLRQQIGLIKGVLKAFDIEVLEEEGYEADDIIATIVQRTLSDYDEIVIASSDKDILQLVGAKVKVLALKKGITDTILYDEKNVRSKFGVGPERIKDYLALVGDSSDNIPGVAGVGPKTALKLLDSHGSLKGIYGSLEKEKSTKIKELLENNMDQAFKSIELTELKDIEDMDISPLLGKEKVLDYEKIEDVFNSLEFSSLKKRFLENSLRLRYFDSLSTEGKRQSGPEASYALVSDAGSCLEALVDIGTEKNIILGILDEDHFEGRPIGLNGFPAIILKKKGPDASLIIPSAFTENVKVKNALKDILEDKDIEKSGYDLKSLYRSFYDIGIRMSGSFIDYKVLYLLLNPYKANAGIAEILDYCLEENPLSPVAASGPKREQLKQMTLDLEGPEKAMAEDDFKERYYCLVSAFGLFERLEGILLKKIKKEGMEELYLKIEAPLISVLGDMEAKGVFIDIPYLERLIIQYSKDIEELTSQIHKLSGSSFNINSPQQLSEVLFERLGLPVIKKTKTGYSTDAATLAALVESHPVIERLMDYREKVKIKNTYLDVLPNLIDKEKGRLHTSYNQLGTTTGRISSSEPNLQNIPVRTELGRQIRKAFIPGKGFDLLLSADYSQIELRILAHLSKDKNLIEAFNMDKDIHTSTAAEIFNIEYDQVAEEHRRKAKAINFGLIYGMTEYGLKNRLKISEQEARDYIELYFSRYPGVKAYLRGLVDSAREKGYAETIFGRKRYIKELLSSNINLRNLGERLAINTPIQGSAADIMKLSTVLLHDHLIKEGLDSNIVLHVHDEIVLELHSKDLEIIEKIVKKSLENCIRLEVKLKVDLKIGENWYI